MHRIPLLLLTAACLPLPAAERPACGGTRRDVALDEALGPYAYTAAHNFRRSASSGSACASRAR